jgi:hypothetical protein
LPRRRGMMRGVMARQRRLPRREQGNAAKTGE